MNIQNVQIQAFLERIQSKVMRKIEDEYYCGVLPFTSQEQLDQFKQAWQQKLKQQFVVQNNSALNKSVKIPFLSQEEMKKGAKAAEQSELSEKLNPKSSMSKTTVETDDNKQQKQIIDSNDGDCDNDDNKTNYEVLPGKKMKVQEQSSIEKDPAETQGLLDEQSEKDLLFLEILHNDTKQDNRWKKGEDHSKQFPEDDFQLDQDDLDDVSDQVINEDYFNSFDNVLVGYMTKERKTKKRSKEGNLPLASIDFSHLLGTINQQEVLISNLRANLIDSRK